MRFVKYIAVLAVLVLAMAACGDDTADDSDGDVPADDVSESDEDTPADDSRGGELDDDVAAVVDGEEISTDVVEQQVESLAGNPQIAQALEGADGEQTLGMLRAQVVSTMVINSVAIDGAEELDAPVTDEDVAQARSELEEETGGPEGLQEALEQEGMSEDQLRAQLRALAALRNIETALAEEDTGEDSDPETRAQEFINERLLAADVVVNDDYGSWDPQTGQVAPAGGVPEALQQPAPAPES